MKLFSTYSGDGLVQRLAAAVVICGGLWEAPLLGESHNSDELLACETDGQGWEKNCRLKANPMVLVAKRAVHSRFRITYRNGCQVKTMRSPLRLVDAGSGGTVQNLLVNGAETLEHKGFGPLHIVDDRPSFLAVQKPAGCSLRVTVEVEPSPEYFAQLKHERQKVLSRIETLRKEIATNEILLPMARAAYHLKSENEPAAWCIIHNYDAEPRFEQIVADLKIQYEAQFLLAFDPDRGDVDCANSKKISPPTVDGLACESLPTPEAQVLAASHPDGKHRHAAAVCLTLKAADELVAWFQNVRAEVATLRGAIPVDEDLKQRLEGIAEKIAANLRTIH